MTNKENDNYLGEILKQKSQDDLKEQAIREKVRAVVLKEDWAKETFAKIKQQQIDYLKDVVRNIQDEKYVHDLTQRVLESISKNVKSRVVGGSGLLERLRGRPVLILTNHFGAYKLLGISPAADIGVDIPRYNAMYPYLMYFAALKPVANELGNNLYYVSNDFPGVFGEIHRKAGFIHSPPIAENKTAALLEQTKNAIMERPKSAIVSFPEGTTSGKPSGRGPYDLEPFRTGAYVIAAELGIHVVPVCQYFNPRRGYELKVFRPFIPTKGDKETYKRYAEDNRREMQNWLDEKGREA